MIVESSALAPRLLIGISPRAAVATDAQKLGGRTPAELDDRYARLQQTGEGQQEGSIAISGNVVAAGFAGSGAALTDLPAGALTGTIDAARLPAEAARLDGDALFAGQVTATGFVGSGAGLTDVPATALTGQLDAARLPDSAARLDGDVAFTGQVSANGFSGSGAGLTDVPSAALTGSIDAARLPPVAARRDQGNVFPQPQTFTSAWDDKQAGVNLRGFKPTVRFEDDFSYAPYNGTPPEEGAGHFIIHDVADTLRTYRQTDGVWREVARVPGRRLYGTGSPTVSVYAEGTVTESSAQMSWRTARGNNLDSEMSLRIRTGGNPVLITWMLRSRPQSGTPTHRWYGIRILGVAPTPNPPVGFYHQDGSDSGVFDFNGSGALVAPLPAGTYDVHLQAYTNESAVLTYASQRQLTATELF